MIVTSSRTDVSSSWVFRGFAPEIAVLTKLVADMAAATGFLTSCAMKSFNSLSALAVSFALSRMSAAFSAFTLDFIRLNRIMR